MVLSGPHRRARGSGGWPQRSGRSRPPPAGPRRRQGHRGCGRLRPAPRRRWAAVFTPTRWPIGEVGQHHLLQRGYMLGRTHDRTGTVGGAAMASQHHTGVGNHLQRHLTTAVTHQHLPTRVTRWNRINVAPERDSGLITYRARHFQHRAITRRYRPQPLGLSQRPHRGGDTVTAALASVKAHTQPVQPGLGLVLGDVVAEGAPPALGDHPGSLFHRALGPGVIGRADVDTHRIVAGDRPERHLQPPAPRLSDRGHPIKAPPPAQPAQPARHRVKALHQMRLIGRLGQPAAPAPGMRQRPDQHIGRCIPAPPGRWVGQFHPIPLGFSTRRVLDRRSIGRGVLLTRRTHRAQRPLADGAGERRIRLGIAQRGHLVEQRGGPQMRIRGQPQSAVFDILGERVRRRPGTHPRGLLPGQIPAHRRPGHP